MALLIGVISFVMAELYAFFPQPLDLGAAGERNGFHDAFRLGCRPCGIDRIARLASCVAGVWWRPGTHWRSPARTARVCSGPLSGVSRSADGVQPASEQSHTDGRIHSGVGKRR